MALDIAKKENGSELTLFLSGRLDTTTSPVLENEIAAVADGVTALILDIEKLDYISSAGLRVLLSTQKKMSKQGKLTIKNVQENVMEVFEITGFSDILNIE